MESVSSIVNAVSTLSYANRWATMISLGRQSVNGAEAPHLLPLLCEMARSEEHYNRALAAMSFRGFAAATSLGDADAVPTCVKACCQHLCRDPSPKIHRNMLSLAAQWLSDSDLTELLRAASVKHRQSIYHAVKAKGRTAILDAALTANLLGAIANIGLLVHVSTECFAAAVDGTDLVGTPSAALGRIVEAHPEHSCMLLHAQLERALGMDPELPPRLRSAIVTAVGALSTAPEKSARDIGFALMEASFHHLGTSQRDLREVIDVYLNAQTLPTCRYLVREARAFHRLSLYPTRKAWKALRQDTEVVIALIEAEVLRPVTSIFASLPSGVRRHYFQKRRELFMYDSGVVSADIVAGIADEVDRHTEALRNFNLKCMEEQPFMRVEYLSVLPFFQATTLGAVFIGNPKPELRIAAISALTKGSRYHRQDITALLEFCLKRNKEQEPWRRAMLNGLSELPSMSWLPEHLAPLSALLQATYDAVDTSTGTLHEIESLLLHMCASQTDFVTQELPKLVKHMDRYYGRSHTLNSATAPKFRAVFRSLLPTFTQWARESMHAKLFPSLQCFPNERLILVKDEMRGLLDICMASKNAQTVQGALEYMHLLFPEDTVEAVKTLITAEPDAIHVSTVVYYVSRHLQGAYIEPYLVPVKRHNGRFERDSHVGAGVFILLPAEWCYRLTGEQQHRYTSTLVRGITTDFKMVLHTQRSMLQCISALPSASVEDGLLPITAESNEEDAFARDCALMTLGRMQDTGSLLELMRALEDSRARVAMVAIQRRLKCLPTADAVTALRPALASKLITVQKEAVRFIGDLGNREALACLEEFAREKGDSMHRDVRIAFMRGIWNSLDSADTWAVFDRAAESTLAQECIAITDVPVELLRKQWQLERYTGLLVRLMHHSDSSVQMAVAQKVTRSPELEHPCLYDVYLTQLNTLKESNVSTVVVNSLLQFRGVATQRIVSAFTNISEDYNLRSATEILLRTYNKAGVSARARLSEVIDRVANVLVEQRRQPAVACELLLMKAPGTWAASITRLEQHQMLHYGVVAQALNVIENGRILSVMDKGEIAAAESQQLRQHATSAVLRRMGLQIVLWLSRVGGWNAELYAALEVYKKDMDPWVSDSARIVYAPPREENEL